MKVCFDFIGNYSFGGIIRLFHETIGNVHQKEKGKTWPIGNNVFNILQDVASDTDVFP
jgi:hypothetical protein